MENDLKPVSRTHITETFEFIFD